MEHTKKLALVDLHQHQQQQQQQQQQRQQQQQQKQHVEYKDLLKIPDVQVKSNLSLEMQRILDDPSIADDVKCKLYQRVLDRYLRVGDRIPEVERVDINTSQPPIKRRKVATKVSSAKKRKTVEQISPRKTRQRSTNIKKCGLPTRRQSTATMEATRDLDRIYGDARRPGSFSSPTNLMRHNSKVHRRRVERYLMEQNAYTMHRPVRRRFERRKTYAKCIDDLFQADICDMTNVSAFNDSYCYLLTCIDVFSKFAWVIPLRSKSGREVATAFENGVLTNRK